METLDTVMFLGKGRISPPLPEENLIGPLRSENTGLVFVPEQKPLPPTLYTSKVTGKQPIIIPWGTIKIERVAVLKVSTNSFWQYTGDVWAIGITYIDLTYDTERTVFFHPFETQIAKGISLDMKQRTESIFRTIWEERGNYLATSRNATTIIDNEE